MGQPANPVVPNADTQVRWQQLGELFDRVCELDPASRDSLLAAETLDPDLEAQLRRMLAANDRPSVLDAPPLPGVLQQVFVEPRALADGELLLDRFEIIRLINRGGMGEVYEAIDRELREHIALKTIRPEAMADPKIAQRFRREVHLARRITHPNICRLFDLSRRPAGESHRELLFLTMELLPGDTLGARLKENVYTSAEALPVIRQIAAGLEASHAAGIVHRDLKPTNIMLCPDRPDRVVITDFGLARSITPGDHSLSASKSAHGVGTPAYLAPEQLEGGAITPATDVYSLSVVIFEMVTGQQPFLGESAMEVAFKRLREAPATPRSVNPTLSWGWNDVLLRGMARDPADRYRSVRDLIYALEHPPRFRVPQWWRTATEAKRRRTIGAVAAAITLAVGGWWSAPRVLAHRPPPAAVQAYESGVASLREGGYWRASRRLEQAVQADPDFALAHARLADALQEVDLSDRARASILRASALQQRQWMTGRQQLEIDAVRFAILRDAPRAIAAFTELARGADSPSAALVDLGRAQELGEHAKEAKTTYRRALEADGRSAAAHLRLGGLEIRKQSWDAAKQHLDSARGLFQAAGEAEGVIEARQRLAELLTRQGRHVPAREELDSALESARKLPPETAGPAQQASLLFRISANSRARGLVEEAVREADSGLAIARQARLETLATRGLIDLGGALLTQRKYDDAEQTLNRALEIATRENFPRLEADARSAMASVKVQQRQYPAAVEQAKRAMQFYRENGYLDSTQNAAQTLSRAYRRQWDFVQARRVLTEQIENARLLGLGEQKAFCHQELANLAMAEGNIPEAAHQREQAIPLFRKAGRLNHAVTSTIERAAALATIGKLAEAEQALGLAGQLGLKLLPEHEVSRAQVQATIALARLDWTRAEEITRHFTPLAESINDRTFTFWRYRVPALFGLARWTEARAGLDAACLGKRDPECETMYSLGAHLEGHHDQAERHAQAGVAALTDHDPAYWRLLRLVELARIQESRQPERYQKTCSQIRETLTQLRSLWGEENVRAYLSRPDMGPLKRILSQ